MDPSVLQHLNDNDKQVRLHISCVSTSGRLELRARVGAPWGGGGPFVKSDRIGSDSQEGTTFDGGGLSVRVLGITTALVVGVRGTDLSFVPSQELANNKRRDDTRRDREQQHKTNTLTFFRNKTRKCLT